MQPCRGAGARATPSFAEPCCAVQALDVSVLHTLAPEVGGSAGVQRSLELQGFGEPLRALDAWAVARGDLGHADEAQALPPGGILSLPQPQHARVF